MTGAEQVEPDWRTPAVVLPLVSHLIRTWEGRSWRDHCPDDLEHAAVDLVLDTLRSLPIEQRMEAMGMVEARPFKAGGHGRNCASKYGHQCDCAARDRRYWREKPDG